MITRKEKIRKTLGVVLLYLVVLVYIPMREYVLIAGEEALKSHQPSVRLVAFGGLFISIGAVVGIMLLLWDTFQRYSDNCP